MDSSIINALITMASIGVAAAVILYFVAQKFKVIEDPKIDLVDEALPGANCGGCGYAGCRAFAEGMVKAGTMDGFFCPVGGNELMKSIGPILGLVADEKNHKLQFFVAMAPLKILSQNLNMTVIKLAPLLQI